MATNGEHRMSGAPPAVNPYGRVDEELASVAQKEERRKKRMKYVTYGVAFVVFQTFVILVFSLVVMKVKTPKFRVRSATVEYLQATNAGFSANMRAELSVKNENFGRYKYQESTIDFFFQNYKVAEAPIPKGKAGFKSTKKFTVPANLSSANANVPGSELNQGALIPLTSQATLNGKVRLMLIFTKKKSTNMNCTMNLNTSSKQLQDISCN
ncbi:uncharacterized protein LOC113773645 [Coffea eugenioides]|uniref:uncharacterized protein LOC113773645 n=1 Tax=Coffea eugenioides TaxID=49369 RepID=UPI000F60EF87|nr:uncharacterized protein LOC113773645 [Coffea eugenioides]